MDAFINTVNEFIGNPLITVILVSMVPLIELKGSILWARASGMGFFSSFITSYLGSTIIAVAIFFLLVPILNLLKKWRFVGKIANKCETYVQTKAEGAVAKYKDSKMNATLIKQIAVCIFIAIPLPMTGVWTGTAIAVFLGLKFKDIIWPVAVGNLVAGTIISILAELFIDYVDIILYALFGIAILMLILLIVKVALSKPKTEKAVESVDGVDSVDNADAKKEE